MTVTRRNLVGGLAAVPAASALAAPAIAQGKTEWRMVTSWPKNLPGPGVTAQRLADRITAMSGGRLTVKLYAAGEIVPALEVLTAVGAGAAEIGHTAPLFWAAKMPASPIFTAAPFGLTALEHIAWVEQGGGQALWEELYAPFNVRPFMAGNTGFQMGGWFKREIHSIADFKGLKMRIPGFGGLVLQRMGATPVTIAPGEIFLSLSTGVIDATEFLGPFSDMAMGFHKAAKNYYAPGWHEPNGSAEAIVGLDAWEKLPADLQAVVANACTAENAHSLAESEWANAEVLKRLTGEFGVTVREFPADFLAEAKRITGEVMAELAARDDLTRRIVESYYAAARHQERWSQLSMRSYMEARS
jgi:TRAP-type mannitol/chloroaromatic compound transport system substrate-binding protein